MKKHFDVVVLGMGMGALAAGALLARRSFRVLVIGHRWKPPTYACCGATLGRRPFLFLSHGSRILGRMLYELALLPSFRRRCDLSGPIVQVASSGRRLDLPIDPGARREVLTSAFPQDARALSELSDEGKRISDALSGLFDGDRILPPGSFWERLRMEPSLRALAPVLSLPSLSGLSALAPSHDYRQLLEAFQSFAGHAATVPPWVLARTHNVWEQGIARLPEGEGELLSVLSERITSAGGSVFPNDQATRITHSGGKVRGVVVDGEREVGADFVVSDLPLPALLDLAPDFRTDRGGESYDANDVRPSLRKFVLSVVVATDGVPARFGHDTILLPVAPDDDGLGAIHVQRATFEHGVADSILLLVETHIPTPSPVPIHLVRERMLARLERFLPFVEEHYRLIDSCHDARPVWLYKGRERTEVDRLSLRTEGVSVQAEPMRARWAAPRTGFLEVGGDPLRSPLKNALHVGPTVLPALGLEGEWIAAASVARIITKTDPSREKMRRALWARLD